MDFLASMGSIALGSRLKRLSDRMLSDASAIYSELGFDIQSRWFPMLALLHKQDCLTVNQVVEQLGVSQPAVSQFAGELVKADLISMVACEDDGRRRNLTLTPFGREQVQRMQPLWRAIRLAAESLCEASGQDLMGDIERLEKALIKQSLLSRTLEAYHEQND